MPLVHITSNVIATGNAITYGPNNSDAVVARGVVVASSTGSGILGNGTDHDIVVMGSVSAAVNAIDLGVDPVNNAYQSVTILEGGAVWGGGIGISLTARGGDILNSGEVFGGATAILINARGTIVQVQDVVNHGLIAGGATAVDVATGSTTLVRFVNHGTVEGGFSAYDGADNVDRVINKGFMWGWVDLRGGNDTYDGGRGEIDGSVNGGTGADLFIAGAGAETFDGSDGIDTISFRGSDYGVRASLVDDEGTGYASGDLYQGMENVQGSSYYDSLTGNHLANHLAGRGSDDLLRGGAGADTLEGGRGADRMSGGSGHDMFLFTSPDEDQEESYQQDTIRDFGGVVGNNDAIQIKAAGFGGGLVAGTALTQGRFVIQNNAMPPQAGDGDDRFIYRTTDGSLWFDVDGNGAELAVLVANVYGVQVTHADILLV